MTIETPAQDESFLSGILSDFNARQRQLSQYFSIPLARRQRSAKLFLAASFLPALFVTLLGALNV